MTFCDEYNGGCGASLTTTDYFAGFCTQCKMPIMAKETTMMMKPRGHSNVHANQTEPHPTAPDRAMIPIEGGATVYSVKELPPLSLSREEWQEIGERMGWAKYRLSADNACHADNLGG